MSGEPTLPRWLIVVRRDRRELYLNLRQAFESDAQVEVILDRRQATRRTKDVPVEADRRKQPRRRPPAARELALWERAGFHLIHVEEEFKVYQADPGPSGAGGLRPTLEAGSASQDPAVRDREIRRLLQEALRLLEEGPQPT